MDPAIEIEIAGRRIGAAHEPFVICELSGNHNGSLDRALSMIDADTYLAAPGSAAYIEQDQEGGAFAGSGVAIRYHNFAHPVYRQRQDAFVSHMSIVDLLMNCGYGSALEIIRSGRRPALTSSELRKMA